MMSGGKLDRRVRIERPQADDAFDGAGSGDWALVATVWAQVQDMLPSRGERLANGLNIAARPARVRIRYRAGITSAMRLVMGTRVMQIVSAPAVLGRNQWLEFMVEDYSTAGNTA